MVLYPSKFILLLSSFTFTLHLHLVLLQMLLSKATYNWGIHKAINLEEANRQITPSLRHCSNKYKLTREGEKDKKRDEDLKKK